MSEYLIHYNHNHDALGRFARSFGSVSSSSRRKSASKKDKNNNTRKYESTKRMASKKTKAGSVEVSKRSAKSNNTKLSEADRRRLVEHGSTKEVIKNKDRLSNRELEEAITRLQKEKTTRTDLERKLSDLDNPINERNTKSFIDKLSDAGNTLNKATKAVESGVNAYNMAAKIHNSRSSDKWTIIGEKNNNSILEMQKVVMTGSLADVWKNREKMTPAQYKNAVERFGNDAKMQKMMNESKDSKSSSDSSPKKKSEPSIESYDNEQDYERAVRINDNYSKGGWKTYDSKGNEWTTYDYNSSNDSKSSSKQNNPKIESWADVRSAVKESSNKKSEDKAANILENYPDYNDDWKKRKSRY